MKIKLLKKLRKRYNWYFNKDKFPVLIDHSNKTATIYDIEYLAERAKYTLEDIEVKVKVNHTEWAIRYLKMDILKEWGWKYDRCVYKLAIKKYKRKLPK
jgi:hypothetical protein